MSQVTQYMLNCYISDVFLSRDMLRKEVDSGSAIGRQIAPILQSGALLSDDYINRIVLQELQRYDQNQQGFILDGFPRTLLQAEYLHKHYPADILAVNIVLDRQVTIQKLLGRRICKTCGGNFNTAHIVSGGYDMPAILPDPRTCRMAPNCQVDLVKRDDDQEDVIQHRLQTFENNIQPIVQYYERKHRLLHFEVKKGIKDTDALWQAMQTFPMLSTR
jgi:adenylate kinase